MTGELLPSLGDIRPHGHLKLGRFTQHFVDVLDLSLTPLEFFEKEYPGIPRDELRKYLGRFGVSGKMQIQKVRHHTPFFFLNIILSILLLTITVCVKIPFLITDGRII